MSACGGKAVVKTLEIRNSDFRFGSLAAVQHPIRPTTAFGHKAVIPTIGLSRNWAQITPISARNSRIAFAAFGRRRFVYILSTYEKAPHGGDAKSLILWCRHQESNSGPTDYKSFSRTRSDAAYSKIFLEYCRDMATYICGTQANS